MAGTTCSNSYETAKCKEFCASRYPSRVDGIMDRINGHIRWALSHSNIIENKEADTLTRTALRDPPGRHVSPE